VSADNFIRRDARLIMLRELDKQANYSLNETHLRDVLETFGITKSREWVRDELRWLEDMGAVTCAVMGSVMVATATTKGIDHVARRTVIEGVNRPSPES
jgi:hypothetical protein